MSIYKKPGSLFLMALGLFVGNAKTLLSHASQGDNAQQSKHSVDIDSLRSLPQAERIRLKEELARMNAQLDTHNTALEDVVFTVQNGKIKVLGVKKKPDEQVVPTEGNPTSS